MFNLIHWIIYTKEVSSRVFNVISFFWNNIYHCFIMITVLHLSLLGEASPPLTLFVNCGRLSRQPKHVAVLNKNQYIRSVWLCLLVNITL